ncbi:glucose dehydrogenase [FAD, quinone]-like [Ochlerotatus camptorhynchus]|uniref:glucose dehydrogenase [FAD, quinone]-like n=1 Tax=Ochlerotatus camptorhynchus TaxID=644619 RepID=UPI0031E25856
MPRGSYWPRAKMLGGCSAMNFMLYVRGNERDYNSWAESGCEGWSWQEVLEYFRKSERNELFGNSSFHSLDGELKVGKFSRGNPLMETFIDAAVELGYAKLKDINGNKFIGMVELQGTVYKGRRQSAAKVFLSSVVRPNLHLIRNAQVMKVILENFSATGIQFRLQNNKLMEVKAKKEIILSAGAINTPQILMLSGLGPNIHLNMHGIETLVDLPVGKNLQDHVIVAYFIALEPGNEEDDVIKDYLQYLLSQSGLFAGNGGTHITLFLNTETIGSKYPNLQYHYLFFRKGDSYRMPQFLKLMSYEKDIHKTITKVSKKSDIAVVWITLLNPVSVGHIELRSSNPFEKVKIFPNYLNDSNDVRLLVDGLKWQRKFLNTKAMRSLNATELRFKIPECDDNPIDSDEYLKCYVSFFSTTIYHPVGTARMGPTRDQRAVVDPQLRVRGTKGLRVIDASIMPNIISGNTNAPSIMIGEKGADLIKTDWLHIDLSHSEL